MRVREAFSAQGTKLNRRGRENRQTVLATAIRCLAAGGADAMSANRIAKEAGMSWGVIQHQFGDADGVWAAVLEHIADELNTYRLEDPAPQANLAHRVATVVEWLRVALDSPSARAAQTVRVGLHHDHDRLKHEFPKTAIAVQALDAAWSTLIADLFEGLVASRARIDRVRQLLPAAMHGIQMQSELSTLTDAEAARLGLAEAITAYLEG